MTRTLPEMQHPQRPVLLFDAPGERFAGAMTPWKPSVLGSIVTNIWDADLLTLGALASWADTVSALTLTQATGGFQPIVTAAGINGHQTVEFDGTDDYMEAAAITGLSTTNCNIYALERQDDVDSSATARTLLSYGGGAATNIRSIRRIQLSAISRPTILVNGVSCSDTGGSVGATNQHRFNGVSLIEAFFTATTIDGAVSGIPFSGGIQSASATLATTRTRFGAINSSLSQFFKGGINYILATNGTESAAQRAQIEGYLSWRGGIDYKTLVTHPNHFEAP